jgi:DNA topoisomerase-1
MRLVVVESPTKAKTLTSYLGKDYRVTSTMGHIRDLPKGKLGVDTEKNFEPTYELVADKKKAISELKKQAKGVKKIFLAMDPDREGEAIAYHVAKLLNRKADGLARVTFHEITKEAILKAIKKPGKINIKLVDAQQARRILDRLVGYKLSPVLWRKIRRGLSAGRVQSVAVRLIVDREKEIEKFVPEEYWDIVAELRRHLGGKMPEAPTLMAKLAKKNGQVLKIEDETNAKKVVGELEKANYEVAEVIKKATKQNPSPPFTTSTLQQQASRQLRFSSKRTMRAAQRLYEKGLITYHRTDSMTLASQAIDQVRDYINSTYGKKYLPEKPRIYKTKSKMAQEAHESIRPTKVKVTDDQAKLQKDEARLYELIWKRTVACQMATAIWDQTKVVVQATSQKNHYHLTAEGKIIKFDGWLKLFKVPAGEELPEVNQGDDLDLVKLHSEQKFTQPPPRYSEASLIKALEERGIGRPSTYAPTIGTIQDRTYVEKIEQRFHPTPLGVTVNDFLLEYFPKIMDYEFTAQMENNLDAIANGEKKWVPVIKEFYEPFGERVEGVIKTAQRTKVPTEATDEKCPKCEKGTVVIRTGRFGKFLSCSRFPKCKYTATYTPTVEGIKCEKCGGDVVIRKTRKGSQFYGCSNYPDCDWASWRKPKKNG